MIRNLLVLPDGTEVFSGVPGEAAIQSVTVTAKCNPETELTPGGVCAAMVEATLIAPEGLPIQAGEEVNLYSVYDDGTRQQTGIFQAEKPEKVSANIYKLTAYDRVSYLDKDISQWLFDLEGWPYSLWELAQMVCDHCGVPLKDTQLPNGSYAAAAFSGAGITGRQVMQWIAQAAGRFCRATPAGEVEFAWWQPTPIRIGPGQTDTQAFYYQGSLSFSDYTVAPVEKVQIHLTDEDVGAIYPDDAEDRNTLRITGNYLLTTAQTAALEPVAEQLYAILKDITYTPGTVTVSAQVPVEAGDIVTVTDPKGRELTFYVMTCVRAGQKKTLTCTGSPRRDATSAVNHVSYKALTGKVLNLRAEVEGLKIENKDAAGNLASLKLDLDGITAELSRQQSQQEGILTQLTAMEQTADGIHLQVQKVLEVGASKIKTGMGYTFDDTGLHIEKEGDQVSTTIDHTGMQVRRYGENVLQATADGVKAIDITVKNYLVVGSHARLEDYTDGSDSRRTACFFIDGG